MLCLINRGLNEGVSPPPEQLPRRVTVNLNDAQAQQQIYFCERDDSTGELTELGSKEWHNRLINTEFEINCFHIHGFQTVPEGAFKSASEFQEMLGSRFFNYIRVIPWIWASAGKVEQYYNDRIIAEASGIGFARALLLLRDLDFEFFEKFPGNRIPEINILAHSMGNRTFRSAIREIRNLFEQKNMPRLFRHVFMSAPDIPNEALHIDDPLMGSLIAKTCNDVCLYYANDDYALRASTIINKLQSGRMLGETGSENFDLVPKNVVEADCSSFNNNFGLDGHGYYIGKDGVASPVLNHIFDTIANGKIPVGNSRDRQIILPLNTSSFNTSRATFKQR